VRILITNNALDRRAGSELYVRDLALGLLRKGHTPIVYSTQLGAVATEIRSATVPVVDSLDSLTTPPDLIHGQHHIDAMTALLRFPNVPAVYVCHGWLPWEEAPPMFPRILRYVAVDEPCRDRLLIEHGIPSAKVRMVYNFVDLGRFPARSGLPVRPARALVFNNYATDFYTTSAREACERTGIELDVVGTDSGNMTTRPEQILGNYDLVFAKGRSALEALAVGCAVILSGVQRMGPLVTTAELDALRPLNFGLRALGEPISAASIEREISRYDAVDAARVSAAIRAGASSDAAVDQLIALYREVIDEFARQGRPAAADEMAAASDYLRWLAPTYKEANAGAMKMSETVTETMGKLAETENELEKIKKSLGWRLVSRYGPIKHRYLLPAVRRLTGSPKSRNGDE
jgi:Glycosyltransferase Family 4